MGMKRGVAGKVLSGLIAAVVMLTGLPWTQQTVQAADETEISGLDWEHELDSGTYRLKYESSMFDYGDIRLNLHYKKITIKEGAAVTLHVSNNIGGDDAQEGKDSQPGIQVQKGATLNLYIEANVTIWGGNGWCFRPGSAGIEVQQGAALNIYGGGTLNAIGGNAGDGGTNVTYKPELKGSSDNDQKNGGAGGGGAGAGIGGSGGLGGKAMSYYTWAHYFEGAKKYHELDLEYSAITRYLNNHYSSDIQDAIDGNAGGNCGTVNIDSSGVTVRTTGGQGGTAGNIDTTAGEYKKGDASSGTGVSFGLFYVLEGDLYGGTGQRGTGGGGYPAAGIGGGGGGAGAGGYGGYGGYYAHTKRPETIGDYAFGGGGGGGGGQGYVNGRPGIGGVGESFLRDDRPGKAGSGTSGGEGADGTKHDKHGRYDGMDGHDGGKGGAAGNGGKVTLTNGHLQADGVSTDIGEGNGAASGSSGTLTIDEAGFLSAGNIRCAVSNPEGQKVYSSQLPLTGVSKVSIAGMDVFIGEGWLSYWPMDTSYTVQYTDSNDFSYECKASYKSALNRIALTEAKRINPCTLTLQYSTLATGYTVKNEKGETLTDLYENVPGFQIKRGTKIQVELTYADTGYSTSGWRDGTEGAVWSGTMDGDKSLTAYTKSDTALASYTVSLDQADFQKAEFTFTIDYDSITEDSRSLMLTPVTSDEGMITLYNDADKNYTMNIKIPVTEVNVRTDTDNRESDKTKGSYTKVITGEVQNPQSVRAGSYSGAVSFYASYGTATQVLDLSAGSITVSGDGYTQGDTTETFHGNYRITQSGNQTANTLAIGGSSSSSPRDFSIKLEGLNTSGDVQVEGTENIALTVDGSKLGAMHFEKAENTALTVTGETILMRTKAEGMLKKGDDVKGPNLYPYSYWVKMGAITTESVSGFYIWTDANTGEEKYCYENSHMHVKLASIEVGVENYLGASYDVEGGVFTASHSQIILNLPESADSLTLESRIQDSEKLQAEGVVLTSSTFTIEGKGTLKANGGQYGKEDITDGSESTSSGTDYEFCSRIEEYYTDANESDVLRHMLEYEYITLPGNAISAHEKGIVVKDPDNRKVAFPALSLDANSSFIVNGGVVELNQSSYLTGADECVNPIAGTVTVRSVPEQVTEGTSGPQIIYPAINAKSKPVSLAETGGTVTLNGGNLELTLNGAATTDVAATIERNGGTINGQ